MKIWGSLFALLLSLSMTATDPSNLFEKANGFYAAGSYDSARVAYEDIVAQHAHFESFFNLGNCYYKLGEMPQAILAFERAKVLNPTDEDLEINLALANSKIKDRIEELDTSGVGTLIETLRSKPALAWYTRISLLLVVLGAIFLGLRMIKPQGRARRTYGTLGTLSLLGFALFLGLAIMASRNHQSKQTAIIMSEKVDVMNDPNGKQKAFVLHEGSKVSIRQRQDGWLYIEIASGDIGWIPEMACEII